MRKTNRAPKWNLSISAPKFIGYLQYLVLVESFTFANIHSSTCVYDNRDSTLEDPLGSLSRFDLVDFLDDVRATCRV